MLRLLAMAAKQLHDACVAPGQVHICARKMNSALALRCLVEVLHTALLCCSPLSNACRYWIWAGVGFLWGSLALYSALGTLALTITNPPSPRPTGGLCPKRLLQIHVQPISWGAPVPGAQPCLAGLFA